jgi:hypothetical protein
MPDGPIDESGGQWLWVLTGMPDSGWREAQMGVSGGDMGSLERHPGRERPDRTGCLRSITVRIKPKPFALFIHDLSVDEARRRSAILDAIGDDWDPIRALAQEMQAHEMLYSNLNSDQQRVYDELVSAGVLPDRTMNRAAD